MSAAWSRIIKKVPIGSVIKNGKEIVLSVATETGTWKRTEEVAKAQGPGFEKAVQADIKSVRSDTKEIISRDGQHTSDEGPRDHFIALETKEVASNDNVPTDGRTTHFPVAK